MTLNEWLFKGPTGSDDQICYPANQDIDYERRCYLQLLHGIRCIPGQMAPLLLSSLLEHACGRSQCSSKDEMLPHMSWE